jgi:hypothetical protein
MKARNILSILTGATLVVWALASCDLGGVTIDQRISTFQSDLNTTGRGSAYQDFDPSDTDYPLLKNGSYFSTAFPPPPPANYSLTVISENNTSSVIVQVTGQSSLGVSPYYLNLGMTTISGNNWVIQTLYMSTSSSGPWGTVVYY